MRTSDKKINPTLKKQIEGIFIQSVADMRDFNETKKFLQDFLTDSEIDAFSKRIAIAYWLKNGRSYRNIKENIKVSSATIASVQSDMQKPGFQLALKKIEAEEWANQWAEKIKKIVKK